jgi:hypothetical protein
VGAARDQGGDGLRRVISLLGIMTLMALMVAASAMPAFAQGPGPDRPPIAAGPPPFAQGPPEGAAQIRPCATEGVAVITPNGMERGACAQR